MPALLLRKPGHVGKAGSDAFHAILSQLMPYNSSNYKADSVFVSWVPPLPHHSSFGNARIDGRNRCPKAMCAISLSPTRTRVDHDPVWKHACDPDASR